MPVLPAQPPVIRVRLEDSSGQALANTVYGFSWREIKGHHVASQTDDKGVLIEPIVPGAKTALLELTDPSWSVVITLATYAAPPAIDGLAARLSNLQMMALAPATQLPSADATAVALAAQRYKRLKINVLKPDATLQTLSPVLVADHDTP